MSCRGFFSLAGPLGLLLACLGCGDIKEADGDGGAGDGDGGGGIADAGGEPDAGCAPTYGGHEICDGLDNDCDGAIDEDCGPLGVEELEAVACPGNFNGHKMAVSGTGAVFILQTPTNNLNPGILHSVSRAGQVSAQVNVDLPLGSRAIARTPGGGMLVVGLASADANLVVDELSSAGATTGTVFDAAVGVTSAALAVDGMGGIYTAHHCCDEPVVKLGNGEAVAFAPGHVNNSHLAISADGTTVFIASGQSVGSSKPGESFSQIHQVEATHSISGIAIDGAGGLLVGVSFFEGPGTTSVYRFEPGSTDPVPVIEVSSIIRGPVYDPENDELYLHTGAGTDALPNCNVGALYRLPLGTAP